VLQRNAKRYALTDFRSDDFGTPNMPRRALRTAKPHRPPGNLCHSAHEKAKYLAFMAVILRETVEIAISMPFGHRGG
jgi:hypothetical protein